jgi:hypothetical protein
MFLSAYKANLSPLRLEGSTNKQSVLRAVQKVSGKVNTGSQSGLYLPNWGQGVLEVGSSERVVHIFTIEVTFDQTLQNWYHFKKPIHRTENLLTVKQLLNTVSYSIVRRIYQTRF